MKTTLSTQAYRWREDLGDGSTREHVGRIVLARQFFAGDDSNDYFMEYAISSSDGVNDCDMLDDADQVLVQHAHTRELEFVEFGKLTPYPSEPIPEPSASAWHSSVAEPYVSTRHGKSGLEQ